MTIYLIQSSPCYPEARAIIGYAWTEEYAKYICDEHNQNETLPDCGYIDYWFYTPVNTVD